MGRPDCGCRSMVTQYERHTEGGTQREANVSSMVLVGNDSTHQRGGNR